MATREEILFLIESNIPDNGSRRITAAMLREVLISLLNNGLIKDSDHLKDFNYDTGQTLEQLISTLEAPIWGYTGTFAFGGSNGEIGDNYGFIKSAHKVRLTDVDTKLLIEFKGDIIGKHVVVNVMTDSGDLNANNDLGTPVVKQYNNAIEVGMRSFGGNGPAGIRLQCLIFDSQSS